MAGTITALKLQSRSKNRINVYLDEQFAFGLSKALANELAVGKWLSDQEIQKLLRLETEHKLYQKALRLIALRPRSEAELRKAFQKKNKSLTTQDSVLKKLSEVGLLDDRSFAENWVENRLTFRPRGKRALRSELFQKGISTEIIEETLDQVDEEQAAWSAAEKGARRYQSLEYQEFKQKLFGYLSRRGFSYNMIHEVIDRVWNERTGRDLEREEPK